VRLEGFKVTGSEWDGLSIYGQASLNNIWVSGNHKHGLDVHGSAQVTVENSAFSDNDRYGLSVYGSAQVTVKSSSFSDNGWCGLSVWGSARVAVEDCTISGNGNDGLVAGGSAQVTVRDSLIEGNGTDEYCQRYCCCNGIVVWKEAHLEVYGSTIRNNKDWGIGAALWKCGDEGYFRGTVLWRDRGNTITGNGRGDVCLPDVCVPEGACD